MQVFIYGGSSSGKSAWAEHLLQTLSDAENKYYIATMQIQDDETHKRVARHKALRANKGFTTLECPVAPASLTLPQKSAALLECVGTLVANEMFAPDSFGVDPTASIEEGLRSLRRQTSCLIIVSNDVGRSGELHEESTTAYQKVVAHLNQKLCLESDIAVEVVCGIPLFLKGEALCLSSVHS